MAKKAVKKAAGKTATTSSAAVSWKTPRLEGKTVCFLGRFESYGWDSLSAMQRYVKDEGGTATDKLDASVDYLVLKEPSGSTGHEKNAAKFNARGASIVVLNPQRLGAMLIPTKEQALEMIAAGREGHQRLAELLSTSAPHDHDKSSYTFSKLNLKGQDVSCAPLRRFELENSDLRNCRVVENEGSSDYYKFGPLRHCRLDGAALCARFSELIDCTFRNADLSNCWIGNYGKHERCRCDFSKSKLVQIQFSGADASDSNFSKTDLTDADFERTKFHNANFQGACLKSIRASGTDFRGSDFTRADLSEAELVDAMFDGCNLTGAKFCGAVMSNASLKNANLAGADFTGANVATVNFDGADTSKAKGLSAEPAKAIAIGPKLRELSDVAKKGTAFSTSIQLETGKDPIRLGVQMHRGFHASWTKDLWASTLFDWQQTFTTAAEAIAGAVACWPAATPQVFSVVAAGKGTGRNTKKLTQLAKEAWCEAYGMEVPDESMLLNEQSKADDRKQASRVAMVAILDKPDGLKKWNKQHKASLETLNPFTGFDLSNRQLDGIELNRVQLKECNFDNTSLVGANLTFSSYKGSSFRNANLTKLQSHWTHFEDCDFTGANLSEASLERGHFNGAKLCDVNAVLANFTEADLRGADLKGAKLSTGNSSLWKNAAFDETTVFPKGFRIPAELLWKGKDIDPRAAKALKVARSKGPIDLDQFMQLLQVSVDKDRLKKATTMLKAERFKLFAQAKDDHLVGVVKSQNDPDLVYSCRLTDTGQFSCCTQNLNVCGGLRGALCKHLLVLIIGMAKGGEIDATTVNQWIQASIYKKPYLDKDLMGETLLRYKGAEAGEVDWRPMETIPEDYYAL